MTRENNLERGRLYEVYETSSAHRSPLRAPGGDGSGRSDGSTADPSFFTSRSSRVRRLWRHPLPGTLGEQYLALRGLPITSLPSEALIGWNPDFLGGPAVVFEVVDEAGRRVAMNGRYVDAGADPPSKNYGTLSKGMFLTPGALISAHVVVTESPLDALALAAAGQPAVATCGAARRCPEWFVRRAAGRAIVAAQDADQAGDEAAQLLAEAFGQRILRWRPSSGHKDWAEVAETEGVAALRVHLMRERGERPSLGVLRRARDERRTHRGQGSMPAQFPTSYSSK